jgi:hypothetical protein
MSNCDPIIANTGKQHFKYLSLNTAKHKCVRNPLTQTAQHLHFTLREEETITISKDRHLQEPY